MMQAVIPLLFRYGTVVALLLLCIFFSVVTYSEQQLTGQAAALQVADLIERRFDAGAQILVITGTSPSAEFIETLQQQLSAQRMTVLETVSGQPRDARQVLQGLAEQNVRIDAIATNHATTSWMLFSDLASDFPALAHVPVLRAESFWWPNFLKAENLLNIADQIAVIAIVAVGMTVVIITAGIDLSVGSLIALSAVIATLLIRDLAGGVSASASGMTIACLVAILTCGLVGAFSGMMITAFSIPPFIVTLAMMLVGSGLAFILAEGQSIYQVPEDFVWLGRGADLLNAPNAVVLMLLLYLVAHIVMSRTVFGRHVYAVGGNFQAAWLSGVPTRRVIVAAYVLSGLLAGVGGVVMASQLRSGSPTYGRMYELYVIAAVVVGGTSLAGGQGTIPGTLVGAFLIAVIRNGMNLNDIESYTQNVILGLVILGAVLLDKLKHRTLQ